MQKTRLLKICLQSKIRSFDIHKGNPYYGCHAIGEINCSRGVTFLKNEMVGKCRMKLLKEIFVVGIYREQKSMLLKII